MAIICPTVLAEDPHSFREQIERVQPFAERIQIDLTDGSFTSSRTIDLEQAWWPYSAQADLHLMYRRPMENLQTIIRLQPNIVIIHAEAQVDHMLFAAEMHKAGIKAGLCVLKDTTIESIEKIINSFDHLLIFSGDLGHFGGKVDLKLLEKATQAKEIHPDIEIGWDGGINNENAKSLIDGGIDVLNVGGFIQHSDDPAGAYAKLVTIIRD